MVKKQYELTERREPTTIEEFLEIEREDARKPLMEQPYFAAVAESLAFEREHPGEIPPETKYGGLRLTEQEMKELSEILEGVYEVEGQCLHFDGILYLSDIMMAADFIRKCNKK